MKYFRALKDYLVRFTKKGLSPNEIALGIALGTFIGCFPIIGTHTILAIVLASFLRLNTLIVLLGAQISNPVTIPFQLFLSAEIGNLVLYGDLLEISFSSEINYFSHYFLPILFGGFLLGIVVSGTSYLFIKGIFKARQNQKQKYV